MAWGQNLDYKHYISGKKNNLLQKLNRIIAQIKFLRKYFENKALIRYTQATFGGQLNYGISLWGNTTTTNLKPIQAIQVKAARIAIGMKITERWSQKRILDKMGWLNVEKTYMKQLITETHNTLNLKKPMTSYNNMTKLRSLREAEDNKIGAHMDKFGMLPQHQKLKRFKIRRLYNDIPRQITSISNKITLKNI